jgi:hypothetical protein
MRTIVFKNSRSFMARRAYAHATKAEAIEESEK